MASVGILGGMFGLIFPLVGLLLLYFVITIAVRHGIDNSETGRKIVEQIRRENNHHNH